MDGMLHWLAHRFGMNGGHIVFADGKDSDGRTIRWVGFQCEGCKKVSGKAVANSSSGYPPADDRFS